MKYNIECEKIISDLKYNNNDVYDWYNSIKGKVQEMNKMSNWQVSPPIRDTFYDKVDRERDSVSPKFHIESLAYNTLLDRTKSN